MSKLENNTASLQAVSEKINGVNNEVNAQATTIAEIAELLNGKSVPGGGASVKTCTVRITGDLIIATVGATIYENGYITDYRENFHANKSNNELIRELTVDNVVCNSVFSLQFASGNIPEITIEHGEETHYTGRFDVKPTVPGGTTIITSYDND